MQSLLRVTFEQHAARPALQGRNVALSYAELAQASDELAQMLASRGVRAGDVVPLLMARSALLVVAQVALLRLGAAYAPIDLASPDARQRTMLETIGATVLLTDGVPAPIGEAELIAEVVDIAAWWRSRAARAQTATTAAGPGLWQAAPRDSAACVMFTSGSTSVPKGVRVPHAGIVRLVRAANYAHFGPEQRWGFLSSPAFDASTLEVWGALLNGGCCVVQEDPLPALDALGEFLTLQRITDAWLTAALFNAMVDDQLAALGGLRQLLIGGERVSPLHARAMLQAHPQVRLINGYGPTENTTFTLCHAITLADTESRAGVPIGVPIAGTSVRIEPADPAQPMHGELWAAGAGVALGYLGDAEATLRKFVAHEGTRWYRTGDIVRQRSDGAFEFIGRVDRQIKLRGHRIELDEIELALARCPGIAAAAVMVVGDDAEHHRIVAAYSVLESGVVDGAEPDAHALGVQLRLSLPEPAVPSEFVRLPSLPVNLSGKVDRQALDRLLHGLPRDPEPRPAAESARPAGEIEESLAAIWRELLPGAAVQRDSNFLDLGGTSLLALHVAALVHRRMRRMLSPVEVLQHPVLADQALAIGRLAVRDDAHAPGGGPAGTQVLLTRGQQGVLAACRFDPSGCAYLVHVALQLPVKPPWGAWRAAFEQLAQRHPVLRLLAHHDGQRAHATLAPGLVEGWWQEHPALDAAPRDLAWPDALLAFVNRPLDTRTHGSMRVDAWPLRERGALVVWTVHHHAIDEAAMAQALAELDALLQGRTLAPVYGSPFAFQAAEAAWCDAPAATAALAVQLAAAFGGSAAPLARAPAPGLERRFELSAALQRQVRQRCEALGCTPFTLLLTAFGRAVQEVFGPRHRFVSTPFSRRVEPELIEPIGYLLDVRFIESGRRAGETSAQSLARVHAAVLQGQQPSFQHFDALAAAVAAIDPQAARGLTQFGFTWRLDPARPVPLAGHAAQLLRVPQRGARYSLCLHAAQLQHSLGYSIEAVESVHHNGQVAAVAHAFEAQLAALCAESGGFAALAAVSSAPTDAAGAGNAADASVPALRSVHAPDLRAAWSRWLGVAEGAIEPESHFLRSGGSSLTVMRMAAQLRRDHGLRLDVGAFLAEPTFAKLTAQATARVPAHPADCVLIGPADATHVMLLVPGDGGQAASLFTLANELRRRLPASTAVAIVDLDAVLRTAPPLEPLAHVTHRIAQIVRDFGMPRVNALVGFSLGALLLLRVAKELEVGAQTPVWLLDTFAPRTARLGFWRRVERRVAWALYGGRPGPVDEALEASKSAQEALLVRAPAEQWRALFAQLSESAFDAPTAHVRLIQARESVGSIGLLWRRRHNGLVPNHYASWQVHAVDGAHLDVPRVLAATTAGLLVGEPAPGRG
jgi:amino acid adenylation domain-containing protein